MGSADGTPAFSLVLHTWTQDLRRHIHLHAVIHASGGVWCVQLTNCAVTLARSIDATNPTSPVIICFGTRGAKLANPDASHANCSRWRFSPTRFICRRGALGFYRLGLAADERYSLGVTNEMPHLPLLSERPHLGRMKLVTSAKTTQSILPSGQLVLTIEHDLVRGVTPPMLRWWFENLGQSMTYQGQVYPRYLLWHPRDHIHWELAAHGAARGTGQGAKFRIVEAFAANPKFYVDSVEFVEKLDDEGISLVRRELGTEIFRLEHRFGSSPNGATYRSRMIVGAATGLVRPLFNNIVRPRVFSNEMGTAWLTHNVEEVSMFEHLLPALYSAR